MTIYTDDDVMSKHVARALRVLAPATAYFMRNLAGIADVTQLREGDDEYDFFLHVPADQLHEMDQRISDLKFAVRDRFGVMITIMPIPVAEAGTPGRRA
jgi:hypothetical protein